MVGGPGLREKIAFQSGAGKGLAPSRAESSWAGPSRAELGQDGTIPTEPSLAGLGQAEPSRSGPGRDVQSRAEKQRQDGPSFAESICAEPCPTVPIQAEKRKTEPRRAEL